MKRMLAMVLCAVMVLTMIPAVTLTASAAESGDWTTSRSPDGYEDEDNYTPAGGFYYDSEGFHTTSPSFKNCNPYYSVNSKESFNMKEGFSMKIRIDDFSYKGFDEDGNPGSADEWLAFCIGDKSTLTPGNSTHGWGSGWVALNRGTGDGKPSSENFWSHEKDEEGNGAAFTHTGNIASECEVDAQGREIYTLTVTWDGSAYDIRINGVTIAGCSTISANLNELVESGDFYVGIVFHSGVTDGTAALSILEVNGSVPAGTESKEPEENVKVFAEIADSSTIPAGSPALVFDATKSSFKKDPDVQNTKVEAKGDNSYQLTPTSSATFLSWTIRNTLSYEASDFPVFVMLLRNATFGGGQLYYLGGKNMSAGPKTVTDWSLWDDGCTEDQIGEDYYNMVVVDLGAKKDDGTPMYDFSGRLNGFRIDFQEMDLDEPFDICYMAVFRTVEEAVAYKDAYLKQFGEVETEPETDDTATDWTSPATDPATEPPATDVTEAPSTGNATGSTTTVSTDKIGEEGGCSSVIGGASAIVLAAVAAAVALKKKH